MKERWPKPHSSHTAAFAPLRPPHLKRKRRPLRLQRDRRSHRPNRRAPAVWFAAAGRPGVNDKQDLRCTIVRSPRRTGDSERHPPHPDRGLMSYALIFMPLVRRHALRIHYTSSRRRGFRYLQTESLPGQHTHPLPGFDGFADRFRLPQFTPDEDLPFRLQGAAGNAHGTE
jgi:hypothetical protein